MTTASWRCAQASSAARRAMDMAVPKGNWCEGVVYTSRAPAGIDRTAMPSASTGTPTTRAPSDRNSARAGG
jgi:hypothetical protein